MSRPPRLWPSNSNSSFLLSSRRSLSLTRTLGVTLTLTLGLVLLQTHPIVAVPFSTTQPTFHYDAVDSSWYLNASSLNITSIEAADLTTYYSQCQQPACNQITFDLSNNQLFQLPVNLFNPPPITQAILLSHNLFTGETIQNFFPNDSASAQSVITGPPHVAGGSRWGVSLDLSYNRIGPLPPTVFQLLNVDRFTCQWCGLTSLPDGSFNGTQATIVDLSYNDFSSPGSIAPRVFDLATTTSIVLNNCNLRTHSLPTYGLLYNRYSFNLFSMANNPPTYDPSGGSLTTASYLANMPNIFVDLPDGIFSTPPAGSSASQAPISAIALGDFVNYVGVEGLFGNITFFSTGSVTINLGPTVALDVIDAVPDNYCPVQSLARALTNCQQTAGSFQYRFGAYGLNASAEIVPNVPECTFPVISTTCPLAEIDVFISTEPGLLQRPLYQWLNSIVVPGESLGVQWIPPTGNIWSPSLNRSDWMPVDMLCDLTNFPVLTLPALPYPEFSFPPPENMLACLTSTIYTIDWRSASLVSSGLFGGRRANAPLINVAVDLLKLYEGDRPVPLDFFTPLIGHLQLLLDAVTPRVPFTLSQCSTVDCPYARAWLASGCPYIVDQECLPCPAGYYPESISTNDYRSVNYCASCPAGSYCPPYTDASSLPQPQLCQPGSYQQYLHQTSCALCSPGTYNSLEGSAKPSECLQCPPGTANPYSGGKNLTADCQPCPIGTASPSPGVADCADCSPGYYQNQTGTFRCQPCPINTYRDQQGGTSIDACTPCPPLTPLSSAGSTSVFACSTGVTCPNGYYTRVTDSKPCLSLCPQGSYCISGQATPCPPGSFSNTTGLSSCYPCGPGYYSPELTRGSSSADDCSPCPLSTYSPATVSSACTPCPAGTISTVFGSSSNDTCIVSQVAVCNFTSSHPSPLVSATSTYCQLGSVAPIQLSQLLPGGIQLMQAFASQLVFSEWQAVSELTPAEVTSAYRRYTTTNSAPSLRLADYATDDTLTAHGATQPPTDTNSIGYGVGAGNSAISLRATITILIIFLTVAFLAWPLYRRIPPTFAFHFDQFSMNHHIHAGQSPVKQPTQFGSAVTWTFLWIAILVAILLGSASNTVTTTSLVPPSSIPYAGTARADFQITIRGYSSNSTVSESCAPVGTQDGFNHFGLRAIPKGDFCSIAADCLNCDLGSGSSSISFGFPYDTQFFEWELFISSAAPQTWSRRYGVLSQLPGHLFDSQSELQFSAIESYYTDHTHSGDGQVHSGFEFDFIQYQSIQTQSQSTYNPSDSPVIITFVFTKSDIMFDSSASNKLSSFQLVVAILTAIVSLFSIFGMLFNKVERFGLNQLCHLTSGQLNKNDQGEIGVSSQPTHLIGLSHTVNKVDSDSEATAAANGQLEFNPALNPDPQLPFHPALNPSSGPILPSTEMTTL